MANPAIHGILGAATIQKGGLYSSRGNFIESRKSVTDCTAIEAKALPTIKNV
jgi:hypothetical protein